MAIITAVGASPFNGGTITGHVVLSEANKDTTPLQLKPVTGATADATNQLEVYDDAGNLLDYLDAAGNALLGVPQGDTFVSVGAGVTRSAAITGIGGQVVALSAGIHVDLFAGASLLVRDHTAATLLQVAEATGVATFTAGIATTPTPGTVGLSSGTGHQISTAHDAHTCTPVTFNPTAGAAATCAVAISPDNMSYTALWTETEPAGIALDGTIHGINVYVPTGWYLKLTVANATIGTTTYY